MEEEVGGEEWQNTTHMTFCFPRLGGVTISQESPTFAFLHKKDLINLKSNIYSYTIYSRNLLIFLLHHIRHHYSTSTYSFI